MDKNDWNEIYITDYNGEKHFKVSASPASTDSEINNLKGHLVQAKKYPHMYRFLDIETAFIVLNGKSI